MGTDITLLVLICLSDFLRLYIGTRPDLRRSCCDSAFRWLTVECASCSPCTAITGSRGNKTQQKGPLFLFILITAIVIVLHAYFLVWQTFMYAFIPTRKCNCVKTVCDVVAIVVAVVDDDVVGVINVVVVVFDGDHGHNTMRLMQLV